MSVISSNEKDKEPICQYTESQRALSGVLACNCSRYFLSLNRKLRKVSDYVTGVFRVVIYKLKNTNI